MRQGYPRLPPVRALVPSGTPIHQEPTEIPGTAARDRTAQAAGQRSLRRLRTDPELAGDLADALAAGAGGKGGVRSGVDLDRYPRPP